MQTGQTFQVGLDGVRFRNHRSIPGGSSLPIIYLVIILRQIIDILITPSINLNTQLGLNPQDKTYITGVGYNNPKNPCHRPSIHDNVIEPVPGIPVFGPVGHLSEANVYDGAVESKENLYPTGEYETDPYPIFRKYFDCYQNVGMSEFSIGDEAISASVFGYFKNTLGYIALANSSIHLDAKPVKSSVSLKWNCNHDNEKIKVYHIERSNDGVNFEVISTYNTTSANIDNCQMMDKMPLIGDNYYRLKIFLE